MNKSSGFKWITVGDKVELDSPCPKCGECYPIFETDTYPIFEYPEYTRSLLGAIPSGFMNPIVKAKYLYILTCPKCGFSISDPNGLIEAITRWCKYGMAK